MIINLKESKTIQALLTYGARKLEAIGINTANLEARILMQYVTNKPIEYLLARFEEVLPLTQQITFKELINRRLTLEPIAYIIGVKEFYGYQFIVNNKVLIPRQDTEIIVEAILNENNNLASETTILELGTGSGCIAISLLLERKNLKLTATDISKDAIVIATQNANRHNVLPRLSIIHSDWFQNLKNKKFDIIVSNPPYISYNDIQYMAPETFKYEPKSALFAENNGLAGYYIIAQCAKNFLKDQGKIFLEIGLRQTEIVKEIFTHYHYTFKQIYRDLAGQDRVLLFIAPS
ncbi:peptide chain release factor N(5)-glutamine methyltransferase [Candidatus Tisiphia endosymbiont of Nemotelus uliginosus]|uniref:peptide chain release factor N(5)-glutamine methyltransferase n=1 Tax=Candidatus Tisiphia endosymbiont of Nemotelus uliginosus TaxID=3077926 RepID=UPI0035C8F016